MRDCDDEDEAHVLGKQLEEDGVAGQAKEGGGDDTVVHKAVGAVMEEVAAELEVGVGVVVALTGKDDEQGTQCRHMPRDIQTATQRAPRRTGGGEGHAGLRMLRGTQ